MQSLSPNEINAGQVANWASTAKAIGNLEIIENKRLALFCSAKCPGRLILQTYDLAQKLRQGTWTVISGFHTPMEQECLTILLRGPAPVIVCPARTIETMRVPREWVRPLEEGRLLVLSPFHESIKRITRNTAEQRNEFVAGLADTVFVAHASPGGKTEALCRQSVQLGKRLVTFDCTENTNLIALGAQSVEDGVRLEEVGLSATERQSGQ